MDGLRVKLDLCTSMCTCQADDFELIPMAKTETRQSVEESFGSEFPVICKHCANTGPKVNPLFG